MLANLMMRKMTTDVLVVGGGTAGVVAAIAAAEEGARVVLLDQDSAPGGVGTRAGVHIYWYGSPGGKQDEIDKAMHQTAAVFGGRARGFHPEAKRSVLGEMLLEHGVNVVFNALMYEVVQSGNRVSGVHAATPEGNIEVIAKVVIDATGDGDVAAAAGVSFEKGRAVDGILQGVSVIPRRVEEGDKLNFLNFDAGWIDPQDPWDLSEGYVRARALLWELAVQEPHLLSISPWIGLRESRQIRGDYTLTWDDITHNRAFPDVITHGFSHYDNHAYDFAHESDQGQTWTVILGLFFDGIWCRIPYRCLLPQGVDGLLVACRAISLDRDAHMLLRMQREMQKIGEVAGVAAAHAIQKNQEPRQVDIAALQKRLIARGVLDAADLDPSDAPSLHFDGGPLARQKLNAEFCRQHAAEFTGYLGTEEEGTALWWLVEAGMPVKPALLNTLQTANSPSARRGAAFGLALMGQPEAIPQLLHTFKTRDPERPEKGNFRWKSYPRWVAALVLLRRLGVVEALPDVLAALDENHPTQNSTFLLQYLDTITPRLEPETQRSVANRLIEWSATPGLGEDYQMSGGKHVSLRWAIDLRLALILARCQDARAENLVKPHLEANLAYLREAALHTLELIQAQTSSNGGSTHQRNINQ